MANRRFIDFPIATTVGDSDIILIWQSGVNKQTTKATFLSGLPENLDELNDVAISGLTNGQILRYDSVTGKWENTDQGNLDLNDLNDVSIVSPSNGQVLVYNSSTSKWENSSGGFVPYTGAVTTVNLGAQTIQAGQFVKAGGTSSQFLKADGSIDSTAYGTGSVTSVGLTMPSAFSVANSPITSAGTLAVTGAGTVAQYIRGDGSLADFPEASGGGSSISYYLNGSVNQGTIGGVAYKELNKVPILGAGTDFTINANGYIASFLTDAGDPNLLEIPGGNWNFETYFSASSGGGSPTFYVELYKVSGTTATLIASNSSAPELIAFGTNITAYFSSLAVPTTTLALTDRLAVRYYVTHSGRTITMHTENNHLCQIITTFTTGLTALNGLTAQVQNFATGTTGTDFNIASATATHTFNLPTASATNRGALSSADWTTFNNKQNALGFTPVPSTRTLTINGIGLDLSVDRSWTVGDMLLNTYQNVTGTKVFGTNRLIMDSDGSAQATSLSNTQTSNSALTSHNSFGFNGSNNIYFNKGTTANGGIFAFSNSATRTYTLKDASGTLAFTSDIPANPVGGTGTTNYLPKFTGASTIGNSNIQDSGSQVTVGTGLYINAGTNTNVGNGVHAYYESNFAQVQLNGATGSLIDFSTSGTDFLGRIIYVNSTNAMQFHTASAGTAQMTLNSSGNLGLGVTPSAWGSILKAYQVGSYGAYVAGRTDVGGISQIFVGANSYFDGSNWVYTNSTFATRYYQADGTHNWQTSASGTSGNAITWSPSMTLTSGGNLLVGTTTDNGARLQVSGTAQATKLVSASNAFAGTLDFGTGSFKGIMDYTASTGLWSLNNQTAGSSTTAYFQFQADSTPILTMLKSGNVGIGTSSPSEKLDVIGGGLAAGNGTIRTGITYSSLGLMGTFTNHDLGILTNGSERMRITSGGNVLIGTTTDIGQRLQVSGGYIAQVDGGVRTFLGYDGTGSLIGTTTNHYFRFITNDTERMRITSGGNVGIGTASPLTKLMVQDSGNTYVGHFSGLNQVNGVAIGTNSLNVAVIQGYTRTFSATNNIAMQGDGGNVLIGTTTDPGARLHVNGDIRTAAPSGGSAVNWKLGTARGGTITPNAIVRVEIGGVLVDLDARYV